MFIFNSRLPDCCITRENVILAYYSIIYIHPVKHVQRTLSYHKLFRTQYTMKKYLYCNIDQLRNRNEIIIQA